MELYQLKTFKMVAEEGNLTRASKRLFTSQPAVSAHVKALEDELGVSLFLRTPKGMVLTADGLQLKGKADKVLAAVDEMIVDAARMRGMLQGTIRIGINAEPKTLRLSDLFTEIQLHHPNLHIHLLQSMTGEIAEKLENNLLDAGFIYGTNTSERLFSTELQSLRLLIVAPGHWQEEISQATAKDLGGFPWIVTPEDCPFHTVAKTFFARHGLAPQQVAVVDQESIIKSMVKAGAGISLLMEQEVKTEIIDGRLSVWGREELQLPLSIVCLKRRRDEPMMQTLFSMLSRIWDTAPSAVVK